MTKIYEKLAEGEEKIVGNLRIKRCWNGATITTEEYVAGRWVPTGIECPPPRPPSKLL